MEERISICKIIKIKIKTKTNNNDKKTIENKITKNIYKKNNNNSGEQYYSRPTNLLPLFVCLFLAKAQCAS
jgi:hypothetical protein